MQNGFIESFNGKFRGECLNLSYFLGVRDAKAIATAGAPIGHWRLRCAVAWPTGAQGQGSKRPRAKSLGHRPGEAEPKVVAAVARIDDAAISSPHVPGVAVTAAAAINPVRACRRFPS